MALGRVVVGGLERHTPPPAATGPGLFLCTEIRRSLNAVYMYICDDVHKVLTSGWSKAGSPGRGVSFCQLD